MVMVVTMGGCYGDGGDDDDDGDDDGEFFYVSTIGP